MKEINFTCREGKESLDILAQLTVSLKEMLRTELFRIGPELLAPVAVAQEANHYGILNVFKTYVL